MIVVMIALSIHSKAQIGIGTTSPNSMLDVRGSFSGALTTFTTNTIATIADNTMIFTGTSAATLTLPTAAGITGREYWIKNASSNASVLTIATTSAQTIDGISSWTLTQTYKAIRLVSNGTNWYATSENLPGSSGTPWILGGNNIASLQNFGTTSNYDLPFVTNNTEKMRLTVTGNLGIGTNNFNGTYPEKLLVDGGATGTSNYQNVIVGKGNTNSYAQLNIQNSNTGTSASSDVVATADNGNESINYIDMGINGSGNTTTGALGGANTAYIYSTGNDFSIGNATSSKNLTFFTTTGGTYTERMRIDASGNVGIGITNPSYKLHINGTNPLFLNGVQTGASTDSVLTLINGVVKKIHPSALVTSSSNAWSLIGNNGTNPSVNFLGTIDAQPLVIKENNTQVARFEATSIALGNGATTTNSPNSYALGTSANIGFNKKDAFAIGSNAAVNADSSFSIGIAAVTNGINSIAIGNGAAANNANSVAIGKSAVTAYSITDALAIGTNATANASNSIAIGGSSTLANKTVTNASNAIAIGITANANSTNSIAIGTNAAVMYNINPAIALGYNTLVNGHSGIAIGNGAATGSFSNAMALGAGASVTSTGSNSTAIGYNASATLANEIILGDRSNTSLSVGIGTESFSSSYREKLLVDAGASGSTNFQNVIVGKGNTNSYAQLNIQNINAGTTASSDVVATANNGDESVNFIDMGMNSGSNTATGVLGGANTGYLYTTGNDFAIGNGSNSKSLNFFTTASSVYTERMRITSLGNVGIANIAPAEKLDITGNLRFSGAIMPNGNAGTAGYFLQSMGSGTAPVWFDASNFAWLLNGSNVTSLKTFGTTNAYDLPFITNNIEKMRITSSGLVGIGTSTFNGSNPEELLVDAGATGNTNFQNVIVGKGNTNSYAQLNIQNINAGTSASSDVVATANNGDETVNFVDMGINSSAYTGGIMGGSNDGYLYSLGQNFLIGNGTAAKALVFMTGGTSQATNERMRIDGTGKVGIGTNNPTSTMQVAGSVAMSITSKTAAYTATASDYSIICGGTSSYTISLPQASTCSGRVYVIKKTSASMIYTVTIDPNGTETIDGSLTRGISTQYDSVMIQSDGSNWFVLN